MDNSLNNFSMKDLNFSRLKSLLFNESKSIHHIHIYGTKETGSSEITRKIIREFGGDWMFACSDFLYADGSLKLLLESLAKELDIKTKGDKIEDFFCNMHDSIKWPDENNRRIIIFLDNAQALTNYSPASLRCLFNSYKSISTMTVRFVTCGASCWEIYQANIALGHLPIIQYYFHSPDKEQIRDLILSCNKSLNPNTVRLAIDILFPFCRSPNTLLPIISEAQRKCNENNSDFKSNLILIAEEKLGIASSREQTEESNISEISHSFELMPLAMRFVLVAAYCASNNAVQSDRRFFVKNHGRDKRSERKELRAEECRLKKDIEPKPADLQRIICIYETLIQLNRSEGIRGFDIKNVISSLSSMGLVTITNISNLDMPKIKCMISLESALKIAGSLQMKLHEYLEHPN